MLEKQFFEKYFYIRRILWQIGRTNKFSESNFAYHALLGVEKANFCKNNWMLDNDFPSIYEVWVKVKYKLWCKKQRFSGLNTVEAQYFVFHILISKYFEITKKSQNSLESGLDIKLESIRYKLWNSFKILNHHLVVIILTQANVVSHASEAFFRSIHNSQKLGFHQRKGKS